MKTIISYFLFIVALFAPTYADDSAAPTKPSDIPVEAFARLNTGDQMKMSPDAAYLAYITPHEGRKHIKVFKLDGSHSTLLPPIKDADIIWFVWKNDDIMLISYRFSVRHSSRQYAYTRLMTYNVVTDKLEQLIRSKEIRTWGKERLGNVGDNIVDFLEDDPDHILLQLDDDYDAKASIFKINVRNKIRKHFHREDRGISNWRVDENHIVRWGSGFYRRGPHDGERVIRYLNPVTDKWENVQEKEWYKKGIRPIKFFDDPRYAYVKFPNEKGLNALAKFDLVEGKVIEEIFSHDTVDILGVTLSPETGRIIGAVYTEHYGKIHFFSKSYEKLFNNINRAMGDGWSNIASMNLKKKLFLIRYNNSNTAGEYHLLNGNTGRLQHILDVNEQLPQALMSEVKPVQYESRDGLTIHGYLTLPTGKETKMLPTVIFPHGGPHARDSMSFDVWAQLFASRGYAVLQPNFRGSTGYGDDFKSLGENQWGGAMQDDVTDGTQWLINQGIADPENICILGGSYGGYAALMGAVKEPDLYKCAISINGVSDLPALVHGNERFLGGKVWNKKIGLEGKEIKSVSPYHRANEIKIPVLIIHAKDDPVVPLKHGKGMAKKLKRLKKPVTYVEVKNGDHFLDTAEARLAAFKAMEIFLKEHLD